MIALSSDTRVETMEIYRSVKQSRNKMPGLAAVADDRSVFFAKQRRKEGRKEGAAT
jgi:hypothetical protein